MTYSHYFKALLFMRVGKKAEIEQCWQKKQLTFGCAANWIDYQLRGKDNATGDIFECIYAHLPFGDPRIIQQVDFHGNPMGNNLLVLQNEADGSYLLRYIPAILTPILCVYSINKEMFPINLADFASKMGYPLSDVAFLFIKDLEQFFKELKEQIPIAISANTNLTSERFYTAFDPTAPIDANLVDYDKYTANQAFIDRRKNLEELFWKLPEYRYQSECRIVIPKINFVQGYDPNQEYDFRKNRLNVFLPNFHNYAEIHYPKIKTM